MNNIKTNRSNAMYLYDFNNFVDYIKNRNRFFALQDMQKFMIDLGTFADNYCTKVLEKDCRELFRARIYPQINNNISHEGVTEYEKVFEPKEMGAPPPEKTKGGRLNPPGIPYLYLSSSKKTALAEMRPWVGAYICIAQFATVRKLKILDLTLDLDEKDIHDSDLKCFLPWTIGLQNAFSEPVCCEDVNSYTPTQYFAEYFKSLGFDGIKYESAMNHHGKNLAIFNPEDAIIKGKVNKIAIEIIDFSYIDADSDIPRTFTSYVKK